jgi:hypothetical protein
MTVSRAMVAALAVATAACSSVQPIREPVQFIAASSPSLVYVTHRNRSVLAIANPRVSGDTLHGTWAGETRPVALPLSQVQSVEALQRDRKRTAFLVAGLGIFTGVAVYAFLQNDAGREPWECDWNSALPRCG